MHQTKKDITFGKRAEKYDNGFEGKFLKKFYDLVEKNVYTTAGDKMLDVACGTGTMLSRFQKKGIECYGLDYDEQMLQVARKRQPMIRFDFGDSTNMPYEDEYFNMITVNMGYHHFEDRNGFGKECLRILKTGGKLYVSELRLPGVVRTPFNGIAKHLNINARFFSQKELVRDFELYGFQYDGSVMDGRVQIVMFNKLR